MIGAQKNQYTLPAISGIYAAVSGTNSRDLIVQSAIAQILRETNAAILLLPKTAQKSLPCLIAFQG
jgi:hypothetical protein